MNSLKKIGCLILAIVMACAVGCGKQQEVTENESTLTDGQSFKSYGEMILMGPSALLVTGFGDLYIADQKANVISKLDQNTIESFGGQKLLNSAGIAVGGFSDNSQELALFDSPMGLAEWAEGIVVADTANNRLRFIKENQVYTLAGSGEEGNMDGKAKTASFHAPRGLAVSPDMVLYIADSLNGSVRAIDEKGNVSTVITGLNVPTGLCFDGDVLYITDMGDNCIYSWSNNTLTLVAGVLPIDEEDLGDGFSDGEALDARFCAPTDVIAVNGALYVADSCNGAIRKIKDGEVTTVLENDGADTTMYPIEPVAIAELDGTLYIADAFLGAIYTCTIME